MRKHLATHRILYLVLISFIGLRTGMIVFRVWSATNGADFPESMAVGNFAFDLLNQTWRGWPTYTLVTLGHVGYVLVTSLLAWPLFKVFGDSAFVFAWLPTLISSGTIALLYVVLRKYFGARAAVISILLFLASPIGIHGWDVYPGYYHVALNFYILLGISVALTLIETPPSKKKEMGAAALGLLSGLGIFMTEIYALVVVGFVVLWAVYDRAFFRRREFRWFLMGAAIFVGPYLHFANPWDFIRAFARGEFNFSYNAWQSVSDANTTLSEMAVLFWPLQLFSPARANPLVAIVGIVVTSGVWVWTLRRPPGARVMVALGTFANLYLLALLASRVPNQIYFFPIYIYVLALWAIGLAEIESAIRRRFPRSVYLTTGMLLVVCAVHPLAILRRFDWPQWRAHLHRVAYVERAHCFYWPPILRGGAGYPAFDGYKTATTLEVESFARENPLRERNVAGPAKVIQVSDTRRASLPLTSPPSYLIYGIDVSRLGFESMAAGIFVAVPPPALEYAYKSFAVFFVNDLMFAQVAAKIREGAVERYIQAEYRHYFYEELGRRLRDRFAMNISAFEAWMAAFPPYGHKFIRAGFTSAKFVRVTE
jgi:hypothetical protein